MTNKMKRYEDKNKETLWEKDYYDGGIYLSTSGIYKSPDGKYFIARYYSNQDRYSGNSYLNIISEQDAKDAITIKYGPGEIADIEPFYHIYGVCGYNK